MTTRPSREGPEVQTEDLSDDSRLAEVATCTREVGGDLAMRGLQTAGTAAAVNDSAAWIPGVGDTDRRDAIRLLDVPHAVEHLTEASQATWGVDREQARIWVTTQAHTLTHEDPAAVVSTLHDLPVAEAGDPRAATAAREATLCDLTTRRDQIPYATFGALGSPLGSGAVERANKLAVEARLKRSGMHGARAHLTPLLALWTVACAGPCHPTTAEHGGGAAGRRTPAFPSHHDPPTAPPAPTPALASKRANPQKSGGDQPALPC